MNWVLSEFNLSRLDAIHLSSSATQSCQLSVVLLLLHIHVSGSEHTAECHQQCSIVHDVGAVEQKENVTQRTHSLVRHRTG